MSIACGLACGLLAAALGQIQAEQLPRNFMEILSEGSRVAVSPEGAGYVLVLVQGDGEGADNAMASAEGAAAYRQAVAALQVAENELQTAVEANRRVANTIPQTEVQRLQLAVQNRREAAREAQIRASRPQHWAVRFVGDDYVGLHSRHGWLFVPVASIRAIAAPPPQEEPAEDQGASGERESATQGQTPSEESENE